MQWAQELGIKLDFNTSMFSHPKSEGGYTIASYDDTIRGFWIEHRAGAAENIAEEMGKRQGSPCVLNHWMVDGSKDAPVDRYDRRALFIPRSLDAIRSKAVSKDHVLDAIESKLFGIGLESFTVGSGRTRARICGYAGHHGNVRPQAFPSDGKRCRQGVGGAPVQRQDAAAYQPPRALGQRPCRTAK